MPTPPPCPVTVARWCHSNCLYRHGRPAARQFGLSNAARRAYDPWRSRRWPRHWLGVHCCGWPYRRRDLQLGIGVQWIEHAARAGFPSMHVANAAALAGSLTLRPVRQADPGWPLYCHNRHGVEPRLPGRAKSVRCAGGPAHRGSWPAAIHAPGARPLAGLPAAQVATGQRTLTAVRRDRL